MTTRTLLILGHPSPDSFNAALADAYADAAQQAGRELRRIDLHALHFDPILHGAYRGVILVSVQKLPPSTER